MAALVGSFFGLHVVTVLVGIITMSAGVSSVCEPEEPLDYDIAVRFDGGDYVAAVFPQILIGDVQEGEIKLFKVGIDPEPGAVICDPTPEQQATMDEVYAQIRKTLLHEIGHVAGFISIHFQHIV